MRTIESREATTGLESELTRSLEGQVGLVTGASRGIGRAVALALAREGCRLALIARQGERLKQVAEEIHETSGASALPCPCDVARAEEISRVTQQCLAHFKRLDILVNNAGVAEGAPLTKLEPELWDRTMRINLTAPYLFSRAVLPTMLHQKSGRIINIASTAGKTGFKYVSAYAASKHALIGFTRSVALEVAEKGITVNAVCPGYVRSEMMDRALDNIMQVTSVSRAEAFESLQSISPQHRVFEPEEVAYLVVMLARPEARGINGQAINLCGGQVFY